MNITDTKNMKSWNGEDIKPSAGSAGYALGDKVRLLKDIWDDGEDHHPPGYLARKGEVLIVKCGWRKANNLPATVGIAHENRADTNFFNVTLDEIERA